MCARFRGPATTVLAITLLTFVLVAPSASAAIGDIVEWPTPTLGSSPLAIAPGPDGALWFVERGADHIGRVTTAGTMTEFVLPPTGGGPTAIAAGSDGAMWFTEQTTDSIGRIGMDGTVTEYPVITAGSMPTGIALGPDGAMWFTERSANRIGRIATDGTVSEYVVPTASSWPTGIALGPDGAMWFTEWRVSRIGRIATDGSILEFPLPGGRLPTGIVTGPDGALWFTAPGTNAIGRLSAAGVESELSIPTANSNPTGIALGPDGALWFTEQGTDRVGRIAGDGTVTEHVVPTAWSGPSGVAAGSDGNLWFTESSVSAVARLELVAASVDLDPPVVQVAQPSDGAAYLVGQVVTADYGCTDGGGSGLATCAGPVASGSAFDTSTAGVHVFEVTATDGAGNSTTLSHSYIVFTSWDGRITLPPTVATLRAGQPADLHFGLGGDLGPVLEAGSPLSEPVSCGSWTALAAAGPAIAVGPGVHMTGGEYTFRWRTEKTWTGTCRSLVLPFAVQGGMTLRLLVRFA